MVAFNDEPEIKFRRKGDPIIPAAELRTGKPVPPAPARAHLEDQPSDISPSVFFLLSLVIPGLGQLVLRLYFQAILFFIMAIGCWYMFYALGADMFWPIMLAHFGSAISAAAKAKGDEVMQDISHFSPSGTRRSG